jgi:hypothetical protein
MRRGDERSQQTPLKIYITMHGYGPNERKMSNVI